MSEVTPCGFIDDGYTLPGYIAAEPRLYPALRFQYRPMLAKERARVTEKILKHKDSAKAEEIAAETVVAHVSEWTLTNSKGEAVKIAPENVLRMQPRLFDRLYSIVMGREAPDADPEFTGGVYDPANEGADVKN